ncbi:MAG TPA: hypothetical protein VHK69_15120 [Chitinophagaceae bacterium]|nr:hypothetical protein [Chitinophagaceae bacterium]
MKTFLPLAIGLLSLCGCTKEPAGRPGPAPRIIFTFQFDSSQERLNNIGQPSAMPPGHAGQHPKFNTMSVHYVELAPTAFTPLGGGTVLYKAPETTAGGARAIHFDSASFAGDGETFFSIPVQDLAPGTYEWLRVSLAYQNFDVRFLLDTTVQGIPYRQELTGTLAGFIGFNTYIKNFTIKQQTIPVNANKKQGFWGFETSVPFGGASYPLQTTGQAPEGATTVVNPLFATSPVPPGSCVVTTAFNRKLTITGRETADIHITVSLSTNNSFEWKEVRTDGKWEPGKGEEVVDMGIRGMKARVE